MKTDKLGNTFLKLASRVLLLGWLFFLLLLSLQMERSFNSTDKVLPLNTELCHINSLEYTINNSVKTQNR